MHARTILAIAVSAQVFSLFVFLLFKVFYIALFFLLLSFFASLYAFFEKDFYFLNFSLFFLLVAFFIIFLIWIDFEQNRKRQVFEKYIDRPASFNAILASMPDKRSDKTFLNLSLCEHNICVLVKAKYTGYETLKIGDKLKVSGILSKPDNFAVNFDYPKFLESQYILFNFKIQNLELIEEGEGLLTTLQFIKDSISNRFYTLFTFDNAALASGIVLGEKQALLPDIQDIFKKSGLMHIVVLSGYNISVLAAGIFYILFFLSCKLRAVITTFLIILFVIMVGAETPALRAGVMGSLAFLALALRRPADSLHFLFMAFFILFLLRPMALLYDPGFQMSFIVTLGIIIFAPKLSVYFENSGLTGAVSELLAATVVALVSVSPFLAYYMSQLSLSALFANLIVLPLLPLAMLFILLALALSFVSTVLAAPFVFVANLFLSLIHKFASIFASASFSEIHVNLPVVYLFFIYTPLFLYAIYIYTRK